MAPPAAGSGEPAPAAPAAGREPPPRHERDDAKSPRPRRADAGTGAGARLLSLCVKAAVMAAALALFLLFAAAAAVLLLHLFVAARAFRHHRRSRYRVPSLAASPMLAPPPGVGLAPAEIRLLPCFAFSSQSSGSDGNASVALQLCSVCIEAGRAGERWRALPACGHAFHAACVDRWLAKSPTCPVCRTLVAVTVPR